MIISSGILAGHGNNSYRGQVKVFRRAAGARNYMQCDSMPIGNQCGAHTFPYIEVRATARRRSSTKLSTSKIGEDQIFYCKQRGLNAEHAISLIVSGFCKEVFQNLPTWNSRWRPSSSSVSPWKEVCVGERQGVRDPGSGVRRCTEVASVHRNAPLTDPGRRTLDPAFQPHLDL